MATANSPLPTLYVNLLSISRIHQNQAQKLFHMNPIMKTRLFTEKLPGVLDYALAIVISSVPGFAEADSSTKQLYQSMTKELLSQELKSKSEFARRNLRKLSGRKKHSRLKATA